MKVISILGSTGSIGRSTLSVVDLHPEKFKIFALSGFNNNDLLLEQAIKFKPSFIVTKNLFSKKILMDKLKDTKLKTEVLYGDEGYTFIASHEKVTTVVAAITGSAGLISTIEAAKNGKQILLANDLYYILEVNFPLCFIVLFQFVFFLIFFLYFLS